MQGRDRFDGVALLRTGESEVVDTRDARHTRKEKENE